jgi:type IV pilus assembly protein PilB
LSGLINDLPPAPQLIKGEGSLRDASILVFRFRQAQLRCRFAGIDAVRGNLYVRIGGKRQTLDLHDVGMVVFHRRLSIAEADQASVVPFRVRMKGGRLLEGKTCGAIRSDLGLTLFMQRDQGLRRVLIPREAIVLESIGLPLGEVLLRRGDVAKDELKAALKTNAPEQQRSSYSQQGPRLGDQLEGADENALAKALAEKFGFPFIDLRETRIDDKALDYITADVARAYGALPVYLHGHHLVVAVHDPTNTSMLETVRFVAGCPVDLVVAPKSALESCIEEHFNTISEDTLISQLGLSEKASEKQAREQALKLSQQAPIVRMIDELLSDAKRRDASDIHVRPEPNSVAILYRIDGTLVKVRELSKVLLMAILSRIKVIGGMNIAERRKPQDGRYEHVHKGKSIDVRISIIPTIEGESAVLRLLNSDAGPLPMDALGFNTTDRQHMDDLVHRNQGMLLVTGPTGSGKSTTLYSLLNEIRKTNVNVITVEDPVEYHIRDIEQIQVNRQAGLTFASAIRNILRHDPDVIMVGEIRDEETAGIAVESALTGHLMLSTLHTNSAVGTIGRLLEMGIPMYLLNASLLAIMAQRLVRKICTNCKVEVYPESRIRSLVGAGEDERFYHGTGCSRCHQTGYKGRTAAYELLMMSECLRDAISAGGSQSALQALAVEQGMVPLTEHALSLARQGLIPLEEVYRVRL